MRSSQRSAGSFQGFFGSNLLPAAFAMLALALSLGGALAQSGATKHFVDVRVPSLEAAAELQAEGFDVAGVNRADLLVGVVVTDEGLKRLRDLGYDVTVRETREPGVGIEALQDYTDPVELSNLMDQVVANYPTLAEKITLNDLLFEGQTQYAMKITADVALENDRPSFILDAQHHAREVMTPEIAMDMIDYLTSRYATDPQVQRWVDNINIYVVPSVNPDGAAYVFQSDNMWRKNRRPSCPVDPNRNYPFAWASCNGSSGDCSSETNRGLNPGSEPEVQSMVGFIADVRPFFTLSYHTYGEYISYPYGCNDPDEVAALDEVAQDLNDILENDNGQVGQYEVGPIWSAIYLVDGGSIDTQYAQYGAYGFTIEANCCSFQPDYATWRDVTVQRQRTAWQFFLDRTLDGPAIRGRVTDAISGAPVPATVEVQEVLFTHGESPRRADSRGLYHWLAQSGQTYHLDFSMPGYCATSRDVTVGAGPALLDVALVPPTPPQNVSAAGAGDNRIDVSWSPAIDAVEYRVLRSRTSGGPYSEVGVVAAPGTSFEDTTVSGSTPYYYVVRAMQPCDSGNSAEASASTTGACFAGPSFAGLASATNAQTSSCAIDLAWPAATAHCGGLLTYQVHRSPTAPFEPGPGTLIASGIQTTGYSDFGALTDGATYFYNVQAVDSASAADGNAVIRSAAPSGPPATGTWTDDAGDTVASQLAGDPPWAVSGTGGKTGPASYATGVYPNDVCAALESPVLSLQPGATLSFASKYDIETGWDAGIVEVAEGPAFDSWTKLDTVNYPDSLGSTGNACGFPTSAPGTVFSRNHAAPTYPSSDYTASLSEYEGRDVKLRWRFSSDVTGVGAGWWLDDIAVTNTSYQEVCAAVEAAAPTEVGAGQAPLTASRAGEGTSLNLAYGPGCGATDNAVYWGAGPIAGSPAWTGVACGLGNTGQASFDPGDPTPGSFLYFVIVGQNGTVEGSYGRSFDGAGSAERPESFGVGSCDVPQDLTGTCP